jgi:hypothetical protein
MFSAIDETIKEIAVKHGISIGRDDPILIFQTMNSRLLEQHRTAQKELLSNFKEEIEQISSQWQDDAKNKAEKILNSALQASKSALKSQLSIAATEHAKLVKAELSKSVDEIRQLNNESKTISKLNLIACTGILIASGIIAVVLGFN